MEYSNSDLPRQNCDAVESLLGPFTAHSFESLRHLRVPEQMLDNVVFPFKARADGESKEGVPRATLHEESPLKARLCQSGTDLTN